MKRRLIILALALTTSLSVFGGLASLLTSGPDPAETAPIIVAKGGPDKQPDDTSRTTGPIGGPKGGSWGG